MVGHTLRQFRIVEKIGEGGMGAVYRAHDTQLRRDVAVKVLTGLSTGGSDRVQRFLKEARSASSLNHPNILTIYEAAEHDDVPFIAMELVHGRTLEDVINGRPLPLAQVLEIGVQIADGLSKAHSAGIVHRDLKPSNIMVTREGLVKLLDFGLAKAINTGITAGTDASAATKTCTVTAVGTVVGTASYMSPEQAEGKAVDQRSDVFSFGCVLYEMITGRRAFHEGSTVATLSAILTKEPKPVRDIAPDVPSELKTLVHLCLRKEPDRRLQHVLDAKLTLEQIKQDSASVPAHGEVSAPKQRRWPLAVASALFIALIAAGLYFVLRPGNTTMRQAIRPLTGIAGLEWDVSWSPDASFFSYTHNPQGNMDIFVRASSGGEPVRLTSSPADEMTARWSPDGKLIAFVSDRGHGASVYTVAPLGGAERKIAETGIPAAERFADVWRALGAMPWVPGGNEIVFSRMTDARRIALWKKNIETGGEQQLTTPDPGTEDRLASVSFDGKTIAFARQQGGRSSLWTVPSGGGEPKPLLADEYDNSEPAWTADGRRLVFVSSRSGARNVWEMEISTRKMRAVTTGPGMDKFPVVSRSGLIAYIQWNHQTDLHLRDLRGDGDQRLTAHSRDNFSPRFCPDGRTVVYHSSRTGNSEIWALDVVTRAERQLTGHPSEDRYPDCSPDGREVIFLSTRTNSIQLWAVPLDGGMARAVTTSADIPVPPGISATGLGFAPRWAPDGKQVAFLAATKQGVALWTINPDGTGARSHIQGVLHFDWYRPAHRQIVYTMAPNSGSTAAEMRVSDLETGAHAVLHRGPAAEIAVAPDGSGVVFCHSASHMNQDIWMLPLARPAGPGLPSATGPPRRITENGARWHAHGPAWATDGSKVIYTRDADEGDVYVIQ